MLQLDDEELPDLNEYIMSRNGVDFIPSSMVLSAVDAKPYEHETEYHD